MTVRADVNGALGTILGERGLAVEDLQAMTPRVGEVMGSVAALRERIPIPSREAHRELAREVQKLAKELRGKLDTLVVLGCGGTVRGIRALHSALAPVVADSSPELRVVDSVDPHTLAAVLDEVDLHRTAFNFISKSGETPEAVAQLLVVRERILKVLGAVDYRERVIVSTGASSGAFRQIVHDEGFRALTIPDGLEGSFAVLSAAGLFPAAMSGIDVPALLAGAAEMDARCAKADLFSNPALLHAVVLYLAHTRSGRSLQSIYPFADAFVDLSTWVSRLWAESLSSERDIDGEQSGGGPTRFAAAGVTDQRAQLQRVVEGPNDVLVTFVRVEDYKVTLEIPEAYQDLEAVGYLSGRRLGDVLRLELESAEATLVRAGRMTTTIQVPAINPYTVGQLFSFFTAEALIAAALYRVDPTAQDALDDSRTRFAALAGRPGHDQERDEIEAWRSQRDSRFVS